MTRLTNYVILSYCLLDKTEDAMSARGTSLLIYFMFNKYEDSSHVLHLCTYNTDIKHAMNVPICPMTVEGCPITQFFIPPPPTYPRMFYLYQ